MATRSSEPLWLDYETFSECDLKKHGADVYSRHHSTRALMLGWAIGDDKARVWDIDNGEPMPEELEPYLLHNQGEIRAFNAPFEIGIGEHVTDFRYKLPFPTLMSQWKCCKVLAYSMSFAGKLDMILGAVGLRTKHDEGQRLIQKFSKPAGASRKITKEWAGTGTARYTRDSDPEDWALFVSYCREDVEVFRDLWRWLEAYNPMSEYDWYLWQMDQSINRRGIPIDGDLVSMAIAAMGRAKEANTEELKRIVQGPITRGPLLEWFQLHGCNLPNMQKANKEAALETEADPTLRHALELSLQIAQASSSSKWDGLGRRLSGGAEVIRESLQFRGAGRTGRWAGQGVQFHNFKRTTDETPRNTELILAGDDVTMDQISTSIRNAICAPEGKLLVVSDLSSIESRLAGWVCKCPCINITFSQGLDTYKVLAAALYSIDYPEVTKDQRTFAKPAALGCQYMLGGKGLVAYASQYGVDMDLDTAKTHVNTYRELYPELPEFWDWIKRAVFSVVKGNGSVAKEAYGLSIYMHGRFMKIRLPSGRDLSYLDPEILEGQAPWDPDQRIDKFTFMGMRTGSYIWERINAHSGGILENIIQAIAADILALWLSRIYQEGGEIVGHVHDEVILLVDEDRAGAALNIVNSMAAQPIPWAPDLLLTADGYVAERYRKG